MQRSRRALLQRRALGFGGRRLLYKVSLSLVFVLWGLVFLFSLWFSRGDGYREKESQRDGALAWYLGRITNAKIDDGQNAADDRAAGAEGWALGNFKDWEN